MNAAIPYGLFLWAGTLLGVSFIATPAKFLAPSLPLAQALEVGRWTFHVLALIEWGLVAVFLPVAIAQPPGPARHALLALLLLIGAVLALETFALRPLLDVRTDRMVRGEQLQPSYLHTAYIALELVKVAAILVAGFVSGRTAHAT